MSVSLSNEAPAGVSAVAAHGTARRTVVQVRAGRWEPAKRILDVALALVLLVALLPLLLLIALAIRLDSRGPAIFCQRRLGLDMREFEVLKFRTMVSGASQDVHKQYIAKLAAGEIDTEVKKLTGDARVTRVGGILRKTSLDELPQLLNVVFGQMSLVGPRPALEYELDHYDARHYDRFRVRPGLTGLWQVSGRSGLGFREMLDLDREYALHSNALLDARILLSTPVALVKKPAA